MAYTKLQDRSRLNAFLDKQFTAHTVEGLVQAFKQGDAQLGIEPSSERTYVRVARQMIKDAYTGRMGRMMSEAVQAYQFY